VSVAQPLWPQLTTRTFLVATSGAGPIQGNFSYVSDDELKLAGGSVVLNSADPHIISFEFNTPPRPSPKPAEPSLWATYWKWFIAAMCAAFVAIVVVVVVVVVKRQKRRQGHEYKPLKG